MLWPEETEIDAAVFQAEAVERAAGHEQSILVLECGFFLHKFGYACVLICELIEMLIFTRMYTGELYKLCLLGFTDM